MDDIYVKQQLICERIHCLKVLIQAREKSVASGGAAQRRSATAAWRVQFSAVSENANVEAAVSVLIM